MFDDKFEIYCKQCGSTRDWDIEAHLMSNGHISLEVTCNCGNKVEV